MRKAEETNTETPQRENTENSPKGAIEKNHIREHLDFCCRVSVFANLYIFTGDISCCQMERAEKCCSA